MDALASYLATALAEPTPTAVRDMAVTIGSKVRGVIAIIAYGSALREADPSSTLIDYYVIVESSAGLADGPVLRLLGRLVPPNVYYIETDDHALRAKYAVVRIDELQDRVSSGITNPYFWARFSQPVRLVFARDDVAAATIAGVVATAVRTAFGRARGISGSTDPLALWSALFNETYRTELRPEGHSRAADIVQSHADYYTAVSELAVGSSALTTSWPRVRLWGKFLTIIRLCKAAFTFAGGVDYVVWKIERHTGERIALTPWQRRHPLLAGVFFLPMLLRKGVVR